jgi:RNA polymerase sigma-70 factor, ECF subfamily
MSVEGEVSRILRDLPQFADPEETAARLFEAAYEELRRLAASLMRDERPDHTLQATALVNEAYLRLVGDAPIAWQSRAHLFGIVASAMRRVLVEHARRRSAEKRGGGCEKLALEENLQLAGRPEVDILELDRTLARYARIDPRGARVVELRVFGGFKEMEIADTLGVSVRTVKEDWRVAAMWLTRELGVAPGSRSSNRSGDAPGS